LYGRDRRHALDPARRREDSQKLRRRRTRRDRRRQAGDDSRDPRLRLLDQVQGGGIVRRGNTWDLLRVVAQPAQRGWKRATARGLDRMSAAVNSRRAEKRSTL